jgi:hypothetical protein
MEHDPAKLFGRLLGDTTGQSRALLQAGGSLLDRIQHDAHALRRRLGAGDKARLDDYLSTVRQIEQRVQRLSVFTGVPNRFDERLRLMFDMMTLAFQADLTRVASFMMAPELSDQSYDFIGIAEGFHSLSHHANNPQKLQRLVQVQAWNTGEFARFVKMMQELPDGEGSLLDNSIILFGSNMSDSNLHNHFPLPTAIVGGGAGKLKGNRHLRYPDRTPLANVHRMLLAQVGVPLE